MQKTADVLEKHAAQDDSPETPADASDRAPEARADPPAPETRASPPDQAPEPTPARRSPNRLALFARSSLKTVATLAIFALAILAALMIWSYYVTAPWTRDGRIRVQVASVAPQISGQITEIRIVDNQYVHKGDVLYVIDPFDFQVALDNAEADQQSKAADLQVKRTQAERRQSLTSLATTPEEQQQYVGSATQARAAFQAAQVQVSQAQINLKRTQVRSPVNGFVTNLLMRIGDYAHAGTGNVSIIDADSYWIDGYFEETKLGHICVGDRAEAQLMGYASPILGRVQTVTRGISVSNAAASTQGLPDVDPVYTWVRLAQRVPVRIAITDVPPGVPLISGMTATVTVRDAGTPEDLTWRGRLDHAWTGVTDVFSPPQPSPACIPPVGDQSGVVTTLATPEAAPARSPGEINPGLTPGMTQSPNLRR